MGDEAEKTFKLVPFSGKKEDWHKWSKKFLARAEIKNYINVLLGDNDVPPAGEEIDEETEEGALQMKAMKANQLAYGKLILCCEDDVSFGVVDAACTVTLPRGSAAKAWRDLSAKFEPRTVAAKVSLKREFKNCILNDPTMDPNEWVSNLERIRQLLIPLNSPISDEDLIIHILNNFPKEYENMVEKMEAEIEVLTVEEL